MIPRVVIAITLTACWYTPAFTAEPDDERLVRAAGVSIDGPGLLIFFRTRILPDSDRNAIEALIARLGDDDFTVREQATKDLVTMGSHAEKWLDDARRNSRDAEIRKRAEICLTRIESAEEPLVIAAAVRLLAARKPEDAPEILLSYLPLAPNVLVADAIRVSLATLAVRGGKPDPTLIKALADRSATKRSAAALALCTVTDPETRGVVLKLLQDHDAELRARLALALVAQKEKGAVPVLIAALAEAPLDLAYEAEEALSFLAGESAPKESLNKSDDERCRSRDAWAAWWKKNADTAELAKFATRTASLGHILVALHTSRDRGRVVEYDRDGKVIGQIDDLDDPVTVQALPGDRVLIADGQKRLVTERNSRGKILWEYKADFKIRGAQRLANGNTFIVQEDQMIEVDKDGKKVSGALVDSVQAARKARNGDIVCVQLSLIDNCSRRTSTGKLLSSFPAPFDRERRIDLVANENIFDRECRIDLAANGNILAPLGDKVAEYNEKGKIVWEAKIASPVSVARLPNGNILVVSWDGGLSSRVVELTREGKEVRDLILQGRVSSAVGR